MPSPIACPSCKTSVSAEAINADTFVPCRECQSPLLVYAFPAWQQEVPRGETGAAILSAGEASCFYHPAKRAVLPCDACGRFVCALCDVDLNGQHLCPQCVAAGKSKGKIRDLERSRVLHGQRALALAILPVLIWPLTFITAPAALYLSISRWNSPPSLVRPGKLSFVLAALFALAQIIGWIFAISWLLTRS